MKLSRLMLSAFAAAVALVACNKVETDVPENTSLKTVKLSLENVILTKGTAGEKISAGDPVKVNNFKIILTNSTYSQEFTAYDLSGKNPAVFYFTEETLAADPKDYEFHFVSHECTRVIAVANMGDVTLQDIKNFKEVVANQQDQTKLVLWADAVLESTGATHTVTDHTGNETGQYTEVFEADIVLKPTISRFEVDGFVVNFSDTPKFNKIEVLDIAFDHYYPEMIFSSASNAFRAVASGNHIKAVTDYDNQSEVFTWLNTAATKGWYRDSFETGKVVMTPDDPATADVFENRADIPSDDPGALAYHFFAGDVVPTMVIKVLADGNPAYVYTNSYISKQNGNALTALEPGKIYRMSAAGEVDQTGGSVPLPDDFDPIKRCLNITVDVEDWVVELVTPEF